MLNHSAELARGMSQERDSEIRGAKRKENVRDVDLILPLMVWADREQRSFRSVYPQNSCTMPANQDVLPSFELHGSVFQVFKEEILLAAITYSTPGPTLSLLYLLAEENQASEASRSRESTVLHFQVLV
jgi:hypothetical protein